ncbi:MAG: hypothetical protein ACE5H0_10860, partial [Bacteroidota bacterium]
MQALILFQSLRAFLDFNDLICDETVSTVDFDVDCDLVGITGYVTQARRMFELADEFRRRGRLVA